MNAKTNKRTSRSRDALKVRRLRLSEIWIHNTARCLVLYLSLLGPITKTSPSISSRVLYPAVRFVLFFMYVIYNRHFLKRALFSKGLQSTAKKVLVYVLDDWGIGVWFSRRGMGLFSSLQQPNRLWGPPNPYPMGSRGSIPRSKAAGAWSWPFISI
jgi:hypothetical protein